MKKRLLSTLLAMNLMLSLLPVQAVAEETDGGTPAALLTGGE